jgi:hypothetical protein
MTVAETAVYRIASTEIVSDVIDGEAVVVNLSTGAYYTLNATGAMVWDLLRRGCLRAGLHAAACELLSGDVGAVREGCDAFVARLLAEGLIAVDDDPGAAPADRPAAAPMPFVPPALVKYTDMEDLLSLDPVHEVNDLGWPHPTAAKTA